MTKSRRSRLGVGAMLIGIPVSAAAIAVGQALAAPAPDPPQAQPQSRHVASGHELIVRGTAPASDTVVLEYAPRGATVWSQVGSTTAGSNGAFRLTARPAQSGLVRVLDSSSGSLTPFVATSTGGGAAPTSSPVPVDVAARVNIRKRSINVLAGQAVLVRGRLLPGAGGRKVSLQALQGGSWQTLATTRTHAAGRFVLRYVAGNAGRQPIRVRFAGDGLNGRSTAGAGQLTVYHVTEASWYNDGGNTACGFHAQYGVANRTLPCGTTVAFRYGGRSVVATVDDRGPYVGGRDWDLNQNTAAALGFGGVGAVWSSQ